MIKAVIFDYGSVISVTSTGDCADVMQKMTGIPACVFRQVYEKYRFDFDRGLITGSQMYTNALLAQGYTKQAQNQELMRQIALLDMQSWRKVHEDVVDWALSLQKKGYLLGVLSNMPSEFLQYYRKENRLFMAADYCCFSCECHYIKPEKQIYELCLQKLNVKPQEAIFFDDVIENVTAGLQCGIKSFLWTGLEQAKKDFQAATGCFVQG